MAPPRAPGPKIDELVLARLRQHGELPAMSRTLARVTSLAASDEASASQLASVILEDYGLTQKVLRVVNSAVYSPQSEITTISRAIVVLGSSNLRSLVLTLRLFESIPSTADVEAVQSRLGAAFCAGMLARVVAGRLGEGLEEEAFIGALFRTFGQTLVAFYAPEKLPEIQAAMVERGLRESLAVRTVLGMSYADLGATVARELHLPEQVIEAMAEQPGVKHPGRPTRNEQVAALAALSHRMVQAMTEGGHDPARVRAGLDNLLEVFTREHRIRRVDGDEILRLAFGRVEAHAAVLGLPAGPRAMAERLRESMLGPTAAATAETPSPEPDPEAAERVFTRGIQETTRLVLGDPPISELVLVVLETALRGLEEHGAERVAFLLRDPARPVLRFRSGLGPGLEEAREWMTVDLTAERDPFFHALTQGIDVHLEDLPAARVFHTLPPWFRRKTGVLVILPLLVQGRSLGVFLVEGSGKRRISEKVLDYLRILRDQVVLSIVKGAQKASVGT